MELRCGVLRRFAAEGERFLLESVEGVRAFGRTLPRVPPPAYSRGKLVASRGRRCRVGEIADALREVIAPSGGPRPRNAAAAGRARRIWATRRRDVRGNFLLRPPRPKPGGIGDDHDKIIGFDNVRHTIKVIVSVHTDEFETLKLV